MASYNWDPGAQGRFSGSQGAAPQIPPQVGGGGAFGYFRGAQSTSIPALSAPAGLDTPMRITAWDCTIGDQGVSSMALTLSVPPPSKPAIPSSLFFMQAIATLQAQVASLATGGGSAGGGGATVTVAAFNSRSISADFVCAGFTDEQTINEALLAVPNGGVYEGGKVLLFEGTYNTNATIVVPFNNTIIEGMGAATEIAPQAFHNSIADDYPLFTIPTPISTTGQFITFRNMNLTSNANSQRHGSPIGIIQQIGPGELNYLTIDGCVFVGGGASATNDWVYAFVGTNDLFDFWLTNNILLGFGLGGFYLQNPSGGTITGNLFNSTQTCIDIIGGIWCNISQNQFLTTGIPSSRFDGNGYPCVTVTNRSGEITINNNVMENGSGDGPGFFIDSSDPVTISGNVMDCGKTGGGYGVLVQTSIALSQYITITDNLMSLPGTGVVLSDTGDFGISNCVISGNLIIAPGSTGSQEYGILLDGLNGSQGVVHNVVSDNIIQDSEGAPVSGSSDAIHLMRGASGNNIHGNVIRYAIAIGSSFAINVADASCVGNMVYGNDVNGNPAYFNDSGTSTIAWGNSASPGGGGGGVTSFNTRTGAVTLSAADVESTFSAAGDLFHGTGSGTGAILGIGSSGQVLTVVSGEPAWQTPSGGGGFPPAWITFGAGNPLGTTPTAAGIFYFDTTNGGLWVSWNTTAGAWFAIGGDPGGDTGTVTGIEAASNLLRVTLGTSAGAGQITISDAQANAGTGNSFVWFSTGTDGQQSISAFLGSSSQFEWDWNADGSSVLPDMPSTGAGTAFNNPARAPATTTITSGTGKQIDTTHDRNVYVQTATAGSVAIAISADNVTYHTLGTKSVTATDVLINIYVPAGWYLKLTATTATLGTVTYY